ncbi:MAG: hypothetical protein R3E31_07810 [Chloroflexota bacterium]
MREIDPDPLVRAYALELTPPTLADVRPDLTRIADELASLAGLTDIFADTAVLQTISPFVREHNWRFTVFVRGQEIVGVAPWGKRPLGFAVDLGTTKIAAYLVDLETGADLAAAGAPNPKLATARCHQPPQSCTPQPGRRACLGRQSAGYAE